MNSTSDSQQSHVAHQPPAYHIDADPDEMDELAPEAGMVASAREMPAWVVSLGVHVLVLLGLSIISRIPLPDQQTIIDSVMEDVYEESYKFDSAMHTVQYGSDVDMDQPGPA